MINTGIAISPPPEQPSEVRGLLRLAAEPELAQSLIDHQAKWQQIHDSNAALLKQIGKVRDLEAAQAAADQALSNAQKGEEAGKLRVEAMLRDAHVEADGITQQARTQLAGFDERDSVTLAREQDATERLAAIAAREKALATKEASIATAKKAATADRQAAKAARAAIEAMLAAGQGGAG